MSQMQPQPAPSAGGANRKTSGLAVASLVLGIAGFFTLGLGGIVGLVLGCVGLSGIRRSEGRLTGRGLAIAGIATSGASIFVGLLSAAVIAAFYVYLTASTARPGVVEPQRRVPDSGAVQGSKASDQAASLPAESAGRKEALEAYNRGLIAAEAEAWEVAIVCFIEAQEKAPREPRILRSLGLAHARLDHLAAVPWLEAYLALAPQAPDAKAVRGEIGRLETAALDSTEWIRSAALGAAKKIRDDEARKELLSRLEVDQAAAENDEEGVETGTAAPDAVAAWLGLARRMSVQDPDKPNPCNDLKGALESANSETKLDGIAGRLSDTANDLALALGRIRRLEKRFSPDGPSVIQAALEARKALVDNATAPGKTARSLTGPEGDGGRELTLDLGHGVSMKLVRIPAGKLMMGSPEAEEGRDDDEDQHEVTISKPFYMGVTAVTQAQYAAVMGENPSEFKGEANPVESVSWDEAVEFCKKLSEKTGRMVRLPTEAEWEYACRAATKTAYPFGGDDADLENYAWYDGNSDGATHPVGQKKPNAWDLYDMHGNVWEWCADWYEDYPDGAATDPQGPESGTDRVRRGGSWEDSPDHCRSAYRDFADPDGDDSSSGFRVVVPSAGAGLP